MQSISSLPQPVIKEEPCPQCQAIIPMHPYYVPWCEQCEWNLDRQSAAASSSTFARLYAGMGKRASRSLFENMTGATTLKPTWSAAKLLAFGVALLVHGITVGLALLGGGLLFWGWPNLFAIVFGLIFLGGAWISRPRPMQMPPEALSRDELPTLYRIVDQVAEALGTSGVSGIVIEDDFNAAFAQVGWRRQKLLYLGWPLWTILSHEERIALLGHELAHGVNGDSTRGFVVGTAIESLIGWYDTLLPDRIWQPEVGLEGLVLIPVNLVLLGLANLAWLGAYLLIHLLWQDQQRAEYLADYLAARVAGKDAQLATLQKSQLGATCELMIQRLSLTRSKDNVFEALRQQVAATPARELERIRRSEQKTLSRLDVTHPPTAYRVEFIQAQGAVQPGVAIADEEWQRLEEELAPLWERIQRRVTAGV
jgi:Zn-dependent protease with chaperone function